MHSHANIFSNNIKVCLKLNFYFDQNVFLKYVYFYEDIFKLVAMHILC